MYVELQCASYFSFLQGCSAPNDLFARAKEIGLEALAIADINSLSGMVRAHVAAEEQGVQFILGSRLHLRDGMQLLVYPMHRDGYRNLNRLLTLGNGRAGKGKCEIAWQDVEDFNDGLLAIFIPDQADELCAQGLRKFKTLFEDRAYMALTLRHRQNDHLRIYELSNLAKQHGVPTVVTNDVLYHIHERAMLHDVVTCIRHHCTIDTMGDLRNLYVGRYLKSPEEMQRLFADYPEALARTLEIADRCRFSLDELKYQYPEEKITQGLSAIEALKRLTWAGAKWRYPDGVPEKVIELLRHELSLIEQLEYAPYFLTVDAIVRFARSRDILCQGRGSAANSCVCFVLGITSVDPDRNDLLFERFISAERKEPPDIDVDFEHQRREEVIQWVFETYGRNHSAITAVVTRFRGRRAIRDTLKVLGFPEDIIKALGKTIRHWHEAGVTEEAARELNLNTQDRRLRLALELHLQLLDMPRQMSQHPGGFVLTQDRLDELVPIEPARMANRQIIVLDKDDIDKLGWMKVDCLALGMLTCLKKSFDLVNEAKGIAMDMTCIPPEDPKTYAMIRRADTVGTFQIESRAQRSMLPKTRPRTFYDLVIQVAIVRPGPIQGDMVHPYLRRLEGLEPVTFPSPELANILGKTLGVPLFQEQAMKVVITCAGFTPGQADLVRRAQATFKKTSGIGALSQDIIDGMLKNGYTEEFAMGLVKQLEGFGSYGFPESHAFSFAIIAEASSWLKCHHPDVFLAAILNSQPMGFYAPGQLQEDAKQHGVEVRWVDINRSEWDCTLEPANRPGKFAVRLGFRLIKGIKARDIANLIIHRADQPYRSIPDLWRRADTPVETLRKLANADVFEDAFNLPRRNALLAIKSLGSSPLPLLDLLIDDDGRSVSEFDASPLDLKPMTDGANVVEDYNSVGFTKGLHPVAFLREDLTKKEIVTCKDAMTSKNDRHVQVAGMVTVRQRPGSANGVIFMSLEDETGDAQIVIWDSVVEKYKRAIYGSSLILITGMVQRIGEVVHITTRTAVDFSHMLAMVGDRNSPLQIPHQPADELRNGERGVDPRVAKAQIAVKSRDFK